MIKSKLLDGKFKIIAYRGGTEIYPENSIPAIRESIRQCHEVVIEIDLQITKDHEVIAFHDFELDNLTNTKGLVKDFNLDELKKINLKSKTSAEIVHIPSLKEIFENFPNQRFILDLHENNPILIKKVIEIVEKYHFESLVAIVSIDDKVTSECKKLKPNWVYIASAQQTKKYLLASFLHLERFVKLNSAIIFLPLKLGKITILNSRIIQDIRQRNIEIWSSLNFKPYQNVNDKESLNLLKNMAVNAIYTDNPKKILYD